MDGDRKLKEMYNISFNLEDIPKADKCPMHEWYNDLISKTYSQISLFDVTRMLIQKIFLELALAKAIDFVKENPFCGQRYEGELIELLYKLEVPYLKEYKEILQEILEKALIENEIYDWLCEEERKEFFDLTNSFLKKLQEMM